LNATNKIHENRFIAISFGRTLKHELMTSFVSSSVLPLSFSQIADILGQKFPRQHKEIASSNVRTGKQVYMQ